MKKQYFIFLIGLLLTVSSCNDYFELVPIANVTEEEVFSDITRAQQFINPVYSGVINSPNVSLDFLTDNAVSNGGPSDYAISGYSEESFPVEGEWYRTVSYILQINEFFKSGFNVKYDPYNASTDIGLKKRIRGEAFGLRAYYKWILLKNFAGPSAKDPSVMMGIPLFNSLITLNDANQVTRSTYKESYKDITNDLDSAMVNLGTIMRYKGTGDFNGEKFFGRISGEMIWALRARMALFAASPAFKQITSDEAAKIIYNAIIAIQGETVANLQVFGNYNNMYNADDLWRTSFASTGSWESSYYPPSMFGSGKCNPSQNLVDAFPDINGFPITDSRTVYLADKPYEKRDPRFDRFIFYNGLNVAYRNANIQTFDGGIDAPGGLTIRGTRTGYYMKKFLSASVNLNLDETGSRADNKAYPIFTRGGLYLDFAEAATDAYGLIGKDAVMKFSAKDVISKIRLRGGITVDNFMPIASADLQLMSNLVKNERRIEYCFEGERFYDVRRWKLPISSLNSPVMGAKITKTGINTYSYDKREIEKRTFIDRMYYNPIPREEILRAGNWVQNFGWDK